MVLPQQPIPSTKKLDIPVSRVDAKSRFSVSTRIPASCQYRWIMRRQIKIYESNEISEIHHSDRSTSKWCTTISKEINLVHRSCNWLEAASSMISEFCQKVFYCDWRMRVLTMNAFKYRGWSKLRCSANSISIKSVHSEPTWKWQENRFHSLTSHKAYQN